MNRKKMVIIILTIIQCSFGGYCDTIDNYHVSYNNNIYKKYNCFNLTKPETLTLNYQSIKSNDELIVNYYNDTPCSDCDFYLVVYDIGRKKAIIQTTNIGQFSPLTIDLYELVKYSKRTGNNLFGIFYYEESVKNVRCLFKINLSP